MKARFVTRFFLIYFCIPLLSVLRGHSFFHPCHNGQWPLTSRDSYPRFYPLHFLSYLYSSEIASISLLMLSAKQGNYLYHFYNVFGMTRPLLGIEPGTSHTRSHCTLPLGYRGGGSYKIKDLTCVFIKYIFWWNELRKCYQASL